MLAALLDPDLMLFLPVVIDTGRRNSGASHKNAPLSAMTNHDR